MATMLQLANIGRPLPETARFVVTVNPMLSLPLLRA